MMMPRNVVCATLRMLCGCCVFAVLALTVRAQSLTFTTLAGPAGGAGSADGTGSDARFYYPAWVATDSVGNVYVGDTFNDTIRKITPAGVVTTLAGSAGLRGSADGIRSAARFAHPNGVAADSAGNVYVADGDNLTIRKITAAGVVTTLAGSPGVPGSADGTGSAARFTDPQGLTTDGAGNIYVADNHTIRKITPLGVVTTMAGSAGLAGSSDGAGNAARFNSPQALAADRDGNIYVGDWGNRTIRKITPAGGVSTFAGLAGAAGTSDGTGSAARFNEPRGVATDDAGNVYVAETLHSIIRKITPSAVVSTLAGSPGNNEAVDGVGSAARFLGPLGLATDGGGNIYVADSGNHTIRKVSPAAVVTTLAGFAGHIGSVDGASAAARFSYPIGLAIDRAGNFFVADAGNVTIRKITPVGIVSTLAGSPGQGGSADGAGNSARFYNSHGVATDSAGNVYVADTGNNTIRRVTPAGLVTTLAGSPGLIGSDDGTGAAARFSSPESLATDGAGNVYVADTQNSTIRTITPAGLVSTFAGSPGLAGSVDATGSAARFNRPQAVTTDSSGNVYVADNPNGIRKITPTGAVTTFYHPIPSLPFPALTTDGAGNLYALVFGSIRKITPAGVATILAGSQDQQGSEDGTGAAARFDDPMGVAIDNRGNVYVAERLGHKIRIGSPALPDAATIDVPSGGVGVARQLDTSPQTATSWQWRIIRQPAGSNAALSSNAIRNPVFTPDVDDLYVFQVTASNGAATSITTVSLTATVIPSRRHAVRHGP